MTIYANQPGAEPLLIPESVPNPAAVPAPKREVETPQRREPIPTRTPEKVPA